MGMFDRVTKSIRDELSQTGSPPFVDALVGGLLTKEAAKGMFNDMSTLDKAALVTSPVPYVGTATGVAADSVAMAKDPSVLNAAAVGTNFIPFARGFKFLGDASKPAREYFADKALEGLQDLPNFVRGFYASPLAGMFGLAESAVKGIGHVAEQRLSPQAIANQREGVSVNLQQTARRELNKYDNIPAKVKKLEDKLAQPGVTGEQRSKITEKIRKLSTERSMALKKVMGQANANKLYNEQYARQQPKFLAALDDLDFRGFSDLSSKSYYDLVKGSTDLSRGEADTAFREIKKAWNVDPAKNYRMALRNPSTGASGKLIDPVRAGRKDPFGGVNREQLASVFQGGTFTSNRNLLKALENAPNLKNPVKSKAKIAELRKKNKIVMRDGVAYEKLPIKIRNKAGVLKNNEAPIIMGSMRSDAIELGGINYATTIKPNGRMIVMASDENDLLNIPLSKLNKITGGRTAIKDTAIKAPFAKSRMITTVTPFEFDLAKIAKGEQGVVERSMPRAEGVGKRVEETMSAGLPASGRKVGAGSGSASNANLRTAEALANYKAGITNADRITAAANQGKVALLAGKPLVRQEEE
tara:strand:- start:230 stop:1984 length:1755 start_codon:yes stop_codon:yes gene_type:complete